MTTSRLIDATTDTNYVIPAIMVDKEKYYHQYAIHVGTFVDGKSVSFCGQDHYSWMKEVSVNEAPEITCKKCLYILRGLLRIKDSNTIHTIINRKLGAKLQAVHIKKERASKSTNTEPINPLEEEPVDRLLGSHITEIPVAYHRDKTLEQRLEMLKELNRYVTHKYYTLKPLYDHSVQLAKCGFTSSFSDVVEDYNRERGNLQAMLDELNKTAARNMSA